MGAKMEEFISYMNQKTELLSQEEKYLAASDRKDESNLVKIRINVYGICKTFFEVTNREAAGEEGKALYLEKLEKLSEPWKEALKKAKEHEDIQKAVIEEIKLETLEEIKLQFQNREE